MKNKKLLCSAFAVLLMTTACSTTPRVPVDQHEDIDRFETYNRAMFSFNEKVDEYVLEPVAQGYRKVTNQFTRDRVRGILDNIKEPISAGNHLLQGEPKETGISLARFGINTTLGLLGMFDVAEGWGLKKNNAGFDETLATWNVADGPFIVLPFIGPSTPRAATGFVVDGAMNPVYWATQNDANIRDKVRFSYAGAEAISTREKNIELIDGLEEGSVDFYATMRSAYLQNRKNMGKDKAAQDTSYDFDFGIDEEEEVFDEMEQQ